MGRRTVAIVGAGVFGLSLALGLRDKGYEVTVFDHQDFETTGYDHDKGQDQQSASADRIKILRPSYGTKIHYQRLALESREEWLKLNEEAPEKLFENVGMLRVQPTDEMEDLEKETLQNMERDGIRHTQFVKSDESDRKRARENSWESKLLDFAIPDSHNGARYEAVLDSLSGYVECSAGCKFLFDRAASKGVKFVLGPRKGAFEELLVEKAGDVEKAVGIRTKDGVSHSSEVVVIAAGSYSTTVLPELAYHLESSAGSIANLKIDENDTATWNKYAPENFPVITWKAKTRNGEGKDTGSVYTFPRTSDGIIKIGFRGIKFTNFQPAPPNASFSQDGLWSVPLPASESTELPEPAVEAIRRFISVFLPEFRDAPFHSTRMCWYTDSLDNSFVIDYVPKYADKSVFVCTGGSGHGAKFLPVLGKHAADIFENGENATSPLRPFWAWRDDRPRKNGLEDGPNGPREIKRWRRQQK